MCVENISIIDEMRSQAVRLLLNGRKTDVLRYVTSAIRYRPETLQTKRTDIETDAHRQGINKGTYSGVNS